MVNYLLSRSASVDKVHKSNGFTCLHAAAAGGHLAVVTKLLETGSDINAQSAMGKLPEDVIGLGSSKPLSVMERGAIQEAFRRFRQRETPAPVSIQRVRVMNHLTPTSNC